MKTHIPIYIPLVYNVEEEKGYAYKLFKMNYSCLLFIHILFKKLDDNSIGCTPDKIRYELATCLSKYAVCEKHRRTCVWFHNNKC